MNALLLLAAILASAVGLGHSVLGERYIIVRLLRRNDLPRLFGNSDFTARTLRFAWHLTTLAWWGLAAILFLMARPQPLAVQTLSWVMAGTFLASGILTLIVSRGHHHAWMILLAIGVICLCVAI